jgi:hypothetical protein
MEDLVCRVRTTRKDEVQRGVAFEGDLVRQEKVGRQPVQGALEAQDSRKMVLGTCMAKELHGGRS